MTIAFQCQGCQKDIKAPDEATGKRGKCPFCGHSNFIPSPAAQNDELDFAPTDEEEERRRQREVEQLRRQERDLLKETSGRDKAAADAKEEPDSMSLHHHVVNYCLDVANSHLDRLAVHMTHLAKNKQAGLAAVADFITGKAIEPALDKIPPRVLQGFLAQLRDELRAAK